MPVRHQCSALRSAIALTARWRIILAGRLERRRPGGLARSCLTRGPNVAHGCRQQARSRCTRRRKCDDRYCGAQHLFVLQRYVVPKRYADPRTTPSAPFTSDVRRGLLRARTMTPLANSHQLFWPTHCNSPVRGPTNSRIDSAFRTSCARRLKIRMADAGVMTSPTFLQASSK